MVDRLRTGPMFCRMQTRKRFRLVLMRAPLRADPQKPLGLACNVQTDEDWLWCIALAPDVVTPERTARMLALLTINAIPPLLYPPAIGAGVMMPDGSFVNQNNEPLAARIEAEISTLTNELLTQHSSYLDLLCAVLTGEDTVPGFERVSTEHQVHYPDCVQFFAPDPPPLVVRQREMNSPLSKRFTYR